MRPATRIEASAHYVTSGDYDEVTVEAIFTSEEKAHAWADAMNADEQRVSDELADAAGRPRRDVEPSYTVCDTVLDPDAVPLMRTRTTSDPYRRAGGWLVCLSTDGSTVAVKPEAELVRAGVERTPLALWVSCFADNDEHAIEIAKARRDELIAADKRRAELLRPSVYTEIDMRRR